MAEKKNSGPAFPNAIFEPNAGPRWVDGMALRDYFATAALTGLVAQIWEHYDPARIAADAYALADAMIKMREAPLEANARLIAAAPKLLDALVAIVATTILDSSLNDEAREALALVLGEEEAWKV